jgi:hypothetical protein
MKNIFLIPTDKPSKIFFNHNKGFEKYQFSKEPFVNGLTNTSNQNIFITNSEEIKEGDWFITKTNDVLKVQKPEKSYEPIGKKIILTTDQDLIKDGVQAIDDEFLEWFVKNPSCEEVKTKLVEFEVDMGLGDSWVEYGNYYKIIIPKEEPKQETLEFIVDIEKVAMDKLKSKWGHLYTFGYPKRPFPTNYENDLNNVKVGLYEGAKWQAKRMYSEEEVLKIIQECKSCLSFGDEFNEIEWFEQFKKK